jgi:hypothetical protein
VVIEFAPRPEFGQVPVRLVPEPGGLRVVGTGDPMVLASPGVDWEITSDGLHETARATVALDPAAPLVLELRCGTDTLEPHPLLEAQRRGRATRYWTDWLATLTLPRTEREELTTLVNMKSSAFPYFGTNPRSEEPFLNIVKGDRKGHRSYSGKVYWQDETYNDSRVLVHVPETFDVRKPGVIVVFFHGNGATLERDVRDRQLVPQQISDSGVNAVLLAPQLAVNARDSSAGKFWQPNGFKRFMDESAAHLARLYGDPASAKTFANMPIVIVGYSGGFLPTAWSLEVGGITKRVAGVILLDAVYGELDKFASWIEKNRTGFFVSAYTRYTRRHDLELMQMLRDRGITVTESMDGPLKPGSVVFVQTRDGITHRSYVTQAWTEHPVKDVLVKMAAPPTPATRVAAYGNR